MEHVTNIVCVTPADLESTRKTEFLKWINTINAKLRDASPMNNGSYSVNTQTCPDYLVKDIIAQYRRAGWAVITHKAHESDWRDPGYDTWSFIP